MYLAHVVKKRIPVFILLLLIARSLHAQDTESTIKNSIGFKPRVFKKILNRQFTGLITGQSKNSIGNFASLDLKEPKVTFSGSTIFKNGSVLTTNASGGISDGFFAIFNNSKLNTQIALDVQYHMLALKNKELIYYQDSKDAYDENRDRINYETDLALLAVKNHQGQTMLRLTRKQMADQKSELEDALIKEHLPDRKDSLSYAIDKIQFKIDSIDNALKNYPSDIKLRNQINNVRAAALKNLDTSIKVYGFKIGWLTLGYKVQNNSFALFNPKVSPEIQVTNTSFVTHEARVQYAMYKWTQASFESWFWCLGAIFSYGDNLPSLNKKEITETSNHGANNGERTAEKKYDVYEGDYVRDIKGLKLYADYYRFLFKGNQAAIHVYPELKLQNNEKPLFNMGTGFLLSFKDAKQDNAVVNAELYYDFLDLFKTTQKTYRLFERNTIGIRFSFPITFK